MLADTRGLDVPYDCTVNHLPQQPCFEPRLLICMNPGLFCMFCVELHNLACRLEAQF